MGSYAQCWVNNFLIGTTKNEIDPSLISLFRSADKKVISDLNMDIPEQLKHYQQSQLEEPELKIVYYETDAEIVRDRLNLLGYTLDNANESLLGWFRSQRESLQQSITEMETKASPNEEFLIDLYKKGASFDLKYHT